MGYVLVIAWLFVMMPAPAMAAGRKAFIDGQGVLRAHGFTDTNTPDEQALDVPDDFDKHPGRWRWDGRAFVPYTPPPPVNRKAAAVDKVRQATTLEELKAAVLEALGP